MKISAVGSLVPLCVTKHN